MSLALLILQLIRYNKHTCVAVQGRNRTLFRCVFILLHSKRCSAELPLRAGLMRCVNVASIVEFTQCV